MSVFEKVKGHYYNEGISYTLKLILVHLKQLFSTYILCINKLIMAERSLQELINEIKPQIDLEVRKMEINDLPLFNSTVSEKKLQLFGERLNDDGKVGFVVFHKGELAYYTWICTKDEYEPNFQITIKLKRDEGLLLDSYTLPKFRGMKIHTFMSAKRLQYLKDIGCKRAFVSYQKKNTFSRNAHKLNGFREIKEVSLINILGFKFHLWRNIKAKG